ncbi:cerebellar degeneration-related protein 2-like [Argonauta hians]
MEFLSRLNSESDDDEEHSYENDLQLAAEIGKALLESNKDLESQTVQLQTTNAEQAQELDFLTKQLEALRQVNESRMRIYEELDKNVQELEKTNQRLVTDHRADKHRIETLQEEVSELEVRNGELQAKVEELVTAERQREKAERRKTMSVPSLHDINYEDFFPTSFPNWSANQFKQGLHLNPYETEIRKLQDTVRKLKTQQASDKRKREDFEVEVAVLIQDNQNLESKVDDLEKRLMDTNKLEAELKQLQLRSEKVCRRCGNEIKPCLPAGVLGKEVEHDEPQMTSEGKVARLEDGGSVYGSNESIHKVLMETREQLSGNGVQSNVSILSELESQYYALCQKYESLLQHKLRRPRSGTDFEEDEADRNFRVSHKEVQTLLVNLHRCVEVNTDIGDSVTSPPPYRSLFKDIFATLRKSRIEESPEQQAASASATTTTSSAAGQGSQQSKSAAGTPITSPVKEDNPMTKSAHA